MCLNETNSLTCGLVVSVLPSRMCHSNNPMKQGFLIFLQLHFKADKLCNIHDANKVMIHEVPISMDEIDDLFQCLCKQLAIFLKELSSGAKRKK